VPTASTSTGPSLHTALSGSCVSCHAQRMRPFLAHSPVRQLRVLPCTTHAAPPCTQPCQAAACPAMHNACGPSLRTALSGSCVSCHAQRMRPHPVPTLPCSATTMSGTRNTCAAHEALPMLRALAHAQCRTPLVTLSGSCLSWMYFVLSLTAACSASGL